ncbi:MAG TPA: ABC transporter permease, partial [Candidatus Limnocylindrales bacterium]
MTGAERAEAFVFRRTASPQAAARWDRRRAFVTQLRTVLGRAYPRLIGARREPSWLLFEILLPFLTTSAFVFVYRALQAPSEYIGFVVLGGAMTAFWLNILWMMAAQLYWERDQGNLELYFTAPISMMSILFGMAIGGLFMSGTRAAVVLVVGATLYGVVFAVDQWLLLLATFFLTMAALYGLGMVLASFFLLS